MTWLGWLILVVVITAIAAVTGMKPKGTQHLAHTRMMLIARLALLAFVVIAGVAYFIGRGK